MIRPLRPVSFFTAFATIAVLLNACGGGGGGPQNFPVVAPSGGAGAPVSLDQRVSFDVTIPPAPSASAPRLHPSDATPSPIPTSLYISPLTASISVQLIAVNGVSPSQTPNRVVADVPAGCAPGGCVVHIANVAAASGLDRFSIQTYTATAASGSVISSGVVEFSVPAGAPEKIGGNPVAISIGGFVTSIGLSIIPSQFAQGVPGNASVVVVPHDATGAIIVGNAQFAVPISVALSDPVSGNAPAHFAFAAGASSVSLTQPPSAPITLHYDGASDASGVAVAASTRDANGASVAGGPVTVDVVLPTPPPPTPTPTHGPTPPPAGRSLYILDSNNNAVHEITALTAHPAPARSFTIPTSVLQCDPAQVDAAPYNAFVLSLQVNTAGTAFVRPNSGPNCFGTLTPPADRVFAYGPSASGTVAPSATFTLPETYQQGSTPLVSGAPLALNPSEPSNVLVGTSISSTNAGGGIPVVLDVAFGASGATLTSAFPGGVACYPLVGSNSCAGASYLAGQNYPFAVDDRGFTYVAGLGDPDSFQNSVVLVFAPGATSPVAYSALQGPNARLWLDTNPVAIAVEGTTLYMLFSGASFDGVGLSFCAPPADPLGSASNLCADGFPHDYIVAYDTTQLTSPGASGTAVDPSPLFAIGGDTIARFGPNGLLPGSVGLAQRLTVYKQKLYVANPVGPSCDPAACPPASPPGEVDVYDASGLSGIHTNRAPSTVISIPGVVPDGVALGGPGTGHAGTFHARVRPVSATALLRMRQYVRHRLQLRTRATKQYYKP